MLMYLYLALSLLLFILTYIKRWRILQWTSYLMFLVTVFTLLPLPGENREKTIGATQIVFRFDEHRYVQLTGSYCKGIVYYVDNQEQVYTLVSHSSRVITEPFSHPSTDYIFIPLSDYSAIDYSDDGGRTFSMTHIFRWQFDNTPPSREDIEAMTVADNQLLILTKAGEIYASSKAIGTDIGSDILSQKNRDYQHWNPRYLGFRWENVPQTLPAVPEDYQGWHKWQCDWDAEGKRIIYDRYAPIKSLQLTIRQWLGEGDMEAINQ